MMKLTYKIASVAAAMTAGLLTSGSAFAVSLTSVGTELLLSVDVSGSVSSSEFILQRDGYAQAFESTDVIDAIVNSPDGIAVALSYWASNDTALEIGWTQLTTAADSINFANTIRSTARPFSGGTNIPAAINFGVDSILNNTFDGSNLVIDVSGDGTSSVFATQTARDAAVASGITINGLAIGGTSIENFYQDNVIGGDGAFVEAVSEFADVSVAATRKISREVTGGGGGGGTTVPEPATVLGLLTVSALGIASKRKSHKA